MDQDSSQNSDDRQVIGRTADVRLYVVCGVTPMEPCMAPLQVCLGDTQTAQAWDADIEAGEMKPVFEDYACDFMDYDYVDLVFEGGSVPPSLIPEQNIMRASDTWRNAIAVASRTPDGWLLTPYTRPPGKDDRTFHRSVIVVEVLHEDPLDTRLSLQSILQETRSGEYVGDYDIVVQDEKLNASQMTDCLYRLGSEPSFFSIEPDEPAPGEN